MKKYFFSLFSLVFPVLCECCGRVLLQHEQTLCLHCLKDLPKTNYHLVVNNPLILQLKLAAKIDSANAFLHFTKNGVAQKLLHRLKYKDQIAVGTVLGRWFAEDIKDYVSRENIEIIVPIPLHPSRRLKRGYNQAEVIAKGMKEILNLPINNFSLRRRRKSQSQTKKDRVHRWKNTNDLYFLVKEESLIGKRVLLVDDVITTGSTITGAVELLKSVGTSYVSIACIATGKGF
ncbi:ComF family protein [Reichenbachiella versicolor]|uniref:ComF family protein n=1 Tax=Reichenbachiella versicolor TaxID=1821036 RepID=UPI000D6EAEC1|nr:ComF family protein [Reichenbachiella versicolor]